MTSSTGPEANTFTFGFSIKYQDAETNHYYYGYRYYDANIGRWLNRDPIEEQGGVNLYVFIRNSPLNNWDLWGLLDCCGGDTYNPITEVCCEATGQVFSIANEFEWHGTGAMASMGFFVGGAVVHLDLESDINSDGKKYEVQVTAYFVAAALGVIAGTTTFPADFSGAVLPSDFGGLSSIAQIGAGALIGVSIWAMDIGKAVSVGGGFSLGFEYPGAEAYAGWATVNFGREIPCHKW